MPRYIDVDELLRKPPDIHDYYDESGEKDCENGYTIATIKAAPTIFPDDVRGVGEWMPAETELGFSCSVCGKLLDEYVHGGEWVSLAKTPNYCPNCGARMKGAEDGTTD